MAVVTRYGSRFMTAIDNTDPAEKADGAVLGGRVRCLTETVEAVSGDSINSKYYLGKIPSNAVILHISRLHFDDLQTTGSPTLDLGLEGSKITNDDDALAANVDVASAAGSVTLGLDIANIGQKAWEYVNGQPSDPGEVFDVVATLKDADLDAGGTISLELYYAMP